MEEVVREGFREEAVARERKVERAHLRAHLTCTPWHPDGAGMPHPWEN